MSHILSPTTLLVTAFCVRSLTAEVVTVGRFQAKIVPEQADALTFSAKGVVSDLWLDTTRTVEKGTVIAVMDKEKTEQDREDMELQLERERLNKKDEIRKLEAQRSRLCFYLSLNDDERAFAKDYARENTKETPEETLQDIDDRIALLTKELSTLERRRRAEFDAKHEPLTLRMPFTGKLQYNFTLPDDPTQPFDYSQSMSRSFATVCDDSAFYITIHIADTNLSLLPPENFSAYINLPEGKQLRGTYAMRRVEQNNSSGADMLVYFFKVDPANHERAFKMLGSNTEAVLLFSSPADTLRVSKAELLSHPEAGECEDWAQLISRLYPNYVILIVAERDLLIRKKSAPATVQS